MAHRRKGTPPRVADECEAFLEGRSQQLYEQADWPVPLWARLNRLARSSYDDMLELAGRPLPRRGRGGRSMSWDSALLLLARQLVADCDGPDELSERQCAVLQPLEPQAFANGPFDLFPDEFFDFVLHHLAAYEHGDHDRS